jgi:hypothetical protein
MKKLKRVQSDEYYRRELALKADRLRDRRIKELEETARRPSILPSTKSWIARQIELLRSGVAAGQGGGL